MYEKFCALAASDFADFALLLVVPQDLVRMRHGLSEEVSAEYLSRLIQGRRY